VLGILFDRDTGIENEPGAVHYAELSLP
jgi:hypothetical protein